MRAVGGGASALSLPWCWGGGDLGTDNTTPVDFGLFGFNTTDATLYTWDNGTKRVSVNAQGAYLVFSLGHFSRATASNPPGTDRVHLATNFLSQGGATSVGPIVFKPDTVAVLDSAGTTNLWDCTTAYVLNLGAADVPQEITLTARNYPNATHIPAGSGEGDLYIVQIMDTAASVLF